jgi:hypothetical protein
MFQQSLDQKLYVSNELFCLHLVIDCHIPVFGVFILTLLYKVVLFWWITYSTGTEQSMSNSEFFIFGRICLPLDNATNHHSVTEMLFTFLFQYSETNVMHFLFNLLRIKDLCMFQALLAHPQEALNNGIWYTACVLCQLAAPGSWCSQLTICMQYTKCHLFSVFWGWASNARNMQNPLILNTFTAKIDHSRFNNSCLRLPALTLVDLIFQLRSFSLGGKLVQQLQYI